MKLLFSTNNPRLSLSLLLVLIVLSCWIIYLIRPPQAKPASAPLTEFSAERAMQYVRQIAHEPHAIGTPGHARVRLYLLNTLRSLGLQPQVQETMVTNPMASVPYPVGGSMLNVASRSTYVYNVMARLKGRQSGKAVLLVAHYDSQPNTLGAGDDGAGVAAIIEAARAIKKGKLLEHDIIILFTDGEEYGLMGAKAFLRHPWAKDVGFVINLEARGNSGPSMTFEISPENGWIVEQFVSAVPYPIASSLAYEVYRNMPNDTDFTIFRKAGYPGINSAFIDGFVNYHKLTDSPENLDKNSLQHHGDNLLAMTRQIGNASLDHVKAPDKVFFNWAGDQMVHYPMQLDWLWIILLTGTFIAVLLTGIKQKELFIGQIFAGFALYILLLILIVGYCFGINNGLHQALPFTHFFNGSYGSSKFFVAYTLLTIGAFGLLISLIKRWIQPLSLVLGGYLLIYLFIVTSFILLPAVTYLFMFPLLGALAGLQMVLWKTRRFAEQQSFYALILLVAALPALFLILPLVRMLFVTFDLQLPVASMLLLCLLLALILPLWLIIERSLQWRKIPALPVVLLFCGVIVAIVAVQNEAPSATQPQHSQTSYFMNADTKKAVWGSYYFLEADDWNRQFFPNPYIGKLTEIYPDTMTQQVYLKNEAEIITDSVPTAKILSDVTTGSVRHLKLQLHSPRGAAHMEAVLCPKAAHNIISLRLNDETIVLKSQQTSMGPAFDLMLFGLPVDKKVMLDIELKAASSLSILLYDQSIGLPLKLIKIVRPAHVIPEQGSRSNITVIGKTYQF